MERKQIGRHLRRLVDAGVTAGPVLVVLLEKRYPKFGPLGRQALEMIEAFREEGRDNVDSLPTSDANYPSSPLMRDSYYPRQQFDRASQDEALSGLLSEEGH